MQGRHPPTVLGLRGSSFTLNGKPEFLLGFSYYGALGAPKDFILKDIAQFQRQGFNWLRVWATWEAAGVDVSAVDQEGAPREPFVTQLKWLTAECDRRGLVVDITLTRSRERLGTLAAHEKAVRTLVRSLKPHRNWYLDLANEHDVRDGRFVPATELKQLRDLVRRLDPQRLVTASFGGHDLTHEDIQEALDLIGVDFLCPHRPRGAQSPAQTEAQTRSTLALAQEIRGVVPVHYQEPFRRGYTDWEPIAEDFLKDLRGAVQGGAAGWCFHTGQQRDTAGHQPRRCFDLHEKPLVEQLDPEERKVLERTKEAVR